MMKWSDRLRNTKELQNYSKIPTFFWKGMRSLHLKKLFQVKAAAVETIRWNFYAFPQNIRCHSTSINLLSDGGRQYGTKIGEIDTTAATTTAANEIGSQPDKLRGDGAARCSGVLSEVQAQGGVRVDCSRLGYRETELELGNESLLNRSTSNSSRKPSFDFNAHVTGILSSASGKPSAIDDYMEEWLPGCTVCEVSNFMRILGKKSRDKSHLHLKRHLPIIASRIENLLSDSWRPIDVAAMLYSLQCLQEDDDGYMIIVAAMTVALSKCIESGQAVPSRSLSMIIVGLQRNRLTVRQSIDLISSTTLAIKSCNESFSAQAVGNALYGMQCMSSDHAEVRSMISALSEKVKSCKESLSAQHVGNALYGMQCMSSDHTEVRSMISALTGKVHSCKESLDAQAVGNALYGMKSMSSDHAEVRSMISALTDKVHSCKESLDAQAVGNALYGMQCMSSDHVEVLLMISALTGKVRSCKESLSAQAVGNALYGMQCMSSDDEEVRSMISALTGKVYGCEESLDAQAVGNALYGMQCMSSDHAEVRSMISALTGKVHSCKESLSAQHVGNALYGMQSMICDDSYAIRAFLLRHALALPHVEHLSRLELLTIGQAVLLCIPSWRNALDDASYEMWTNYVNSICSEHRRRITSGECVGSSLQKVEQRMHRAALKILEQSRATVSINEYFFDMFESDVVVRIPFVGSTDEAEASADDKWLVINIEVHGINSRQERKKKFCKLRDAYLKSRGVSVHRVHVSVVIKMDDNEVDQWVLDAIAKSLLLSDGLQ